MTKAVIFDCDGVLVDSEVLAQKVDLAALAEIGLDYDHDEFSARFLGMSYNAYFSALQRDSFVRHGCALPPDFRETCRARYTALAEEHLAEVPGALEAVRTVRHPKAVASSSTRPALEKKLKRTGLWDHFAPHIYSADHVANAKPAPDLFLHAAQALDLPPEDCLVLEDSANGVTAARAAGMRVWGFLGGGHHRGPAAAARLNAAGAERVVESWADVTQLFSKALAVL
jgi:HAD superfamily hydrolase (TIGR01509 family)